MEGGAKRDFCLAISTTTDFERPWLKLCFTTPALTAPPVRGFRVRGARPPEPEGAPEAGGCLLLSFSSVMRSLGYHSPDRKTGPGHSSNNKKGLGAIAQPFSLRFLTPTLGEERTKTAKATGIECPALGSPSSKEGGVYHILSAQGQTQFRRCEQTDQFRRL